MIIEESYLSMNFQIVSYENSFKLLILIGDLNFKIQFYRIIIR